MHKVICRYQCDRIEDVDERSQNLTVAVGREECSDGSEDGDDRHNDRKILPGLRFKAVGEHELPPAHA